MDKQIDLSIDWLANAALTPDQRCVWDLARSELATLRTQLHECEVQIKALQQRLSDDDSDHSVLTRPEFNREVARMLAFDERYGGVSSVLYFDFENLNDVIKNHGTGVGSAAVKKICDLLGHSIRTSDIFGRLASNEFGVLLVRCDNVNAWKKGELLASKLQQALLEVDGHPIKPVINFGAYTFSENEDAAKGIKQAASAITHNA